MINSTHERAKSIQASGTTGDAHNTQERFQEHRDQGYWKVVPLNPRRRLYHTAILVRLGVTTYLSNKHKVVRQGKMPK